MICIPRDIPEPGAKEFPAALSALVRESLDISRGRAFVLFTSFRMLESAYRELEPFMLAAGIKGLKQGDSPRHRLLEDFRIHPSAALFGTDSFWEGVDVTGEALSNVIITKLPFSVPDEPVIQARQEEIEARGGNPFMEYIVPQAVIKFRQGFGRLIRSNTDRGSIMVFDRRIVEKNYGREFRNRSRMGGCSRPVGGGIREGAGVFRRAGGKSITPLPFCKKVTPKTFKLVFMSRFLLVTFLSREMIYLSRAIAKTERKVT